MTVDGVNITTPGTAAVVLQVSPDVVQEFQIASVNYDLATSLTSNGSINIVTRSGTNEFRGNGFYVFRSHRLAAYPTLRRDPLNPNPEFSRHQSGSSFGGPLWKDRAFVFGSFERTNQRAVVAVHPLEELAPLGGNFRSPYMGNQANVRVDAPFRSGHSLFVRYTYDRNSIFGNLGPGNLPSSWSERINDARQMAAGVTNVISNRAVNEARLWTSESARQPGRQTHICVRAALASAISGRSCQVPASITAEVVAPRAEHGAPRSRIR